MINLDEELGRSLERRADNVAVRDDLDDILAGPNIVRFSDANTKPKRRSQLLLVAAASALVAGTAGLVWVQNSRSEPASTSQQPAVPPVDGSLPAVSPPATLLSGAEVVAGDEWLWATVLPDGFEFQYADRNNNPSGDLRSVQFGTTGSLTGQLSFWISPDTPSSEGGQSVEVAGRNWTISGSAGQVRGTAAIGDRYIDVGGPVSQSDLLAVIDGLALVSEDQLPAAPLSYDDAMTDVGEFDVNGEQVVMSVDESNGWFCTETRTDNEAGGGCVTYFNPAETISRYHGFSTGSDETTSQLQMSTRGMASTDVARIDVEFINGAVASVVPQNTSGEFSDVRFWTVGAVVDLQPGQDPNTVNDVFVEIRAYNADGSLIATRTSDDDTVGR